MDDAAGGTHDEGIASSPYLNVEQAAGYLNTTISHIRELVYTRRIPFFRVGKFLRFTQADLDAWMQANREEPRTPL